ncbi:glycosyltransferase [Aquibacillus koreensis]|uniref:Glycosyltransferase n=1 Tax=Aquibacillus koreensis TaxID=279446 RepID=A0A9X3WK49_9BACI|nr:glycosyltransferase family 2 protein [Aquibacillus koreensis]MCT2535287.1 glycosyltransferase [Aquibacillus koreensis]MDC3419781.1 glycosyltransferase [Aquibacillus koreensis]
MYKISVIVPFYNVENYIRDALSSLENQSLDQIEVILINDGSNDNSKEIALQFVEMNENFMLLELENRSGPGAARNLGIENATGKYISFLDADDLFYQNTCENLYYLAEKHQCDLVTGNVKQFKEDKEFWSGLHKKAFIEPMEKTSICDSTSLIYDTSVWNKIYRREFLLMNDIKFEKDMLYEDLPFTLKSYLLADTTMVTLDFVYKWRIRSDADNLSITQSKLDIKNLRDRVRALNLCKGWIKQHAKGIKLSNAFNKKVLEHDFAMYINLIPEMDTRYIDYLIKEVKQFCNALDDYFYYQLPVNKRIKYYYILNKDIADLKGLIMSEKNAPPTNKPFLIDGNYYTDYYGYNDDNQELYNVTNELKLRLKLESFDLLEESINIKGNVHINKVDATQKESIGIWVDVVALDETPILNIKPKLQFRDGWSGFSLHIDYEEFKKNSITDTKYYLKLRYRNKSLVREGLVKMDRVFDNTYERIKYTNNQKIIVSFNPIGILMIYKK